MKIRHLPWIISAFAIILFSGYTILYPTGAPAAKTGSPGDGANCTECHGGTAITTENLITSNIPSDGYIPGTTYQITATNPLTTTGKMGFQVSPQNASGSLLGTLVAGAGSQLVGGNKYVTHLQANATTDTWTFGWIAPAAGTGAVTFYGAFARNKPGSVVQSTLVVQEQTSTGLTDFATGIKVLSRSGGNLDVEMNTEVNQAKVLILDLSGRVILTTSIPGKGSSQLKQNLNSGVYLVLVEAGKSVVKQKIFVN